MRTTLNTLVLHQNASHFPTSSRPHVLFAVPTIETLPPAPRRLGLVDPKASRYRMGLPSNLDDDLELIALPLEPKSRCVLF